MRLRFEDCVFDSDTRELLRAGHVRAISPKAFALLEALLECRPRALSKAEIHARLWPDVYVSEANLANLVVELRAAFDDDPRRPRLIRTVSRFGYAFHAEVREETAKRPRPPDGSVYRLVWGRREISLEPGENLIGRDRDAVVWIDDESVSRRHARITVGPDGAELEDLASKNGTRLAGKKIRRAVALKNRDVVKIGPATLTLRVLKSTGSTRSTRSQAPR